MRRHAKGLDPESSREPPPQRRLRVGCQLHTGHPAAHIRALFAKAMRGHFVRTMPHRGLTDEKAMESRQKMPTMVRHIGASTTYMACDMSQSQ